MIGLKQRTVLGVQLNDGYKAYSLRQVRIFNDVVGGEEILVLGSTARGARAYYRGGLGAERRLTAASRPGGTWQVTEEFLVNTADESEKPHMAFFGWFQFHPDTELYTGP